MALGCRAQDELESERTARIAAEDVVSRLKAQLSEVRETETSTRAAAERTLAQLQQEVSSNTVCSNPWRGAYWGIVFRLVPASATGRSACSREDLQM